MAEQVIKGVTLAGDAVAPITARLVTSDSFVPGSVLLCPTPAPRDFAHIMASAAILCTVGGRAGHLSSFCRARGIPLPYRPDPRDGAKGPGLAAALRETGGRTRVPRSVVVITDFDALGDPATLIAAVKLLRSHGHSIGFVVPDARSFAPAPESELEKDLARVYGRGEERRLREARALLAPLGAPIVAATREDQPGLVVARAQSGRRAA